jgi:hypothetical protein
MMIARDRATMIEVQFRLQKNLAAHPRPDWTLTPPISLAASDQNRTFRFKQRKKRSRSA